MLLHLVQDVVILEPVDHFVREAHKRVSQAKHAQGEWKGISDGSKSVTVLKGTLQDFDPSKPIDGSNATSLGRIGYSPPDDAPDADTGFDIIWCQWCLGHLRDPELVEFFQRAQAALRSSRKGTGDLEGIIVVKENLCSEPVEGEARRVFDPDDSSFTR